MAEGNDQANPNIVPEEAPQKIADKPDALDKLLKFFQVVAVVFGVVISVLSFNDTRNKDAAARKSEADARIRDDKKYAAERRDASERQRIEAAKPFLELRQKSYLEAIHAAGILSTEAGHSPAEIKAARIRFRELYVAELSMVESKGAETSMMKLAKSVDPTLKTLTAKQKAAYKLSHALRDSLVKSWKVDPTVVDNPDSP